MALTDGCRGHITNAVVNTCVAVLETAGQALPGGTGFAVASAANLLVGQDAQAKRKATAVFERTRKAVDEGWQRWAEVERFSKTDLTAAMEAYEATIQSATLTPEDVVALTREHALKADEAQRNGADAPPPIPAFLAQAMLTRAIDVAPGRFATTGLDGEIGKAARHFFLSVTHGALASLWDSQDFRATLGPALLQDIQALAVENAARGERMEAEQTRQSKVLARHTAMLDRLEARGALTEENEKAVIALASKINAEVADFDQAMTELSAAVDLLAEEFARSGTTNLGEEIDGILERARAQIRAGEMAAAAGTIDDAIAAEDRAEEERKARLTRLLEEGERADLLNRDAKAAASKIARRLRLDHPTETDGFVAIRTERRKWYERGQEKGVNLDLEVSAHLAEDCFSLAGDPNARGAALNDLGNALQTLGERAGNTDTLKRAVQAYENALLEWTRDRVPLNWAGTQNNLGNVLQTLGKRAGNTDTLQRSVQAYESALLERTRDLVPLDWAMTQNNLGNALRNLGERAGETDTLQRAVRACENALLEWTRDRVPLQWATTQNNLGNALGILGERAGETETLQRAVEAYKNALLEYTHDRAPGYWAMTKNNLAKVERALFEAGAGAVHLARAEAAIEPALEEFRRPGAEGYLAVAEETAADIRAAREGLDGG